MTHIKALRIDPDATVTEIELDRESIQTYWDAIGGYIEFVKLPGRTEPAGTMYVDEEGLTKGLPNNLLAESLARYAPLVGPALIVGPPDDDMEDTDVTEWMRARVQGLQTVLRVLDGLNTRKED